MSNLKFSGSQLVQNPIEKGGTEPEVLLTIDNADDFTNDVEEPLDLDDDEAAEKPARLRQPFRKVGRSIYEMHYFTSVWTERFEQVSDPAC